MEANSGGCLAFPTGIRAELPACIPDWFWSAHGPQGKPPGSVGKGPSTGCSPHQQQQSGDEEEDEVPQQSREPESGHVNSTDELTVLGLGGSLFNCQDGKRARQESYSKKQVDSKIMSFRDLVKDSI